MNRPFDQYSTATGARGPAGPAPFLAEDGSLWGLSDIKASFRLGELRQRPWNLWRYREALPSIDFECITLGEGATPLISLEPDVRVHAKLEYLAPTGSFKDRGAAVMMAVASHWGVERCVVDSSGNAGAAVAAYAARARIHCEVFVPGTNSPGKLRQPEACGAIVHRIDGTRGDVAQAAREHVDRTGSFYASHVYCPFFFEGTKTWAFEIWEQFGGQAPAEVILPAGNGTLVLGAAKGFRELHAAGAIDHLPVITAVQAHACAPLARAFAACEKTPAATEAGSTAAEGIAIADPPRAEEILSAVRTTGGRILTVNDQAIDQAARALARLGCYVETTAAVTYAAWLQHGPGTDSGAVVLPLCGTGLKAG